MNTDIIRENIIKARKKLSMSQEMMAEKIGISRTAYANIESGRTCLINKNLCKIANIIDIPEIKLFADITNYSQKDEQENIYNDRIIEYQDKISLYENQFLKIKNDKDKEIRILKNDIKRLEALCKTQEKVIEFQDSKIKDLQKAEIKCK